MTRDALHGPAGRLDAVYRPLPGARAAAVLCHAHPQHGGSMFDPVLHRVACSLHAAGLSTLRFNFRGVGGSEGRFDGGVGEVDDVRAALDLAARDHAELAVVGFSFGAWVGLRAAAADERVARLVGLGLPAVFDPAFLAAVARPRLLVQGERDDWGDLAALRRTGAALTVVPGADHFFRGHLDAVAAATVAFLAPRAP